MDILSELALKYGTDKYNHGFTQIYNNLLCNYKHDNFNLLEIGVFYGSSIKMWNEYFHNANIYAADNYIGLNGNGNKFIEPDKFIKEVSNNDNFNRVKIVYLDQSKEEELIKYANYCKKNNIKFKIILDDGSHLMKDQQLTFFYLFDLLEDGGIFIVEDTHTSDQNGYDVLDDKSNSTKKLFENIKINKIFSSIYINNVDKCKNIVDNIKNIEHYYIKDGSETTIIYKKNSYNIYFVSFGGYSINYIEAVERICDQAKKFNIFKEIYKYTDRELSDDNEFWLKHSNFILNNPKGYGYWLWKPYIIMKTLEKMNDDDILLYCDAGCELNIKNLNNFNLLLNRTNNKLIIGTSAISNDIRYTKMDINKYLNLLDYDILNINHMQATTLMIKKCDIIVSLINEWYNICSNNYNLIDDSPSIEKNYDNFHENRHDQSIFNILIKKYNLLNYDMEIDNSPILTCRNRSGISIL